jgi:predicted dehydrogenase
MKMTIAILGAGGWGGNWTERALRDPDVEPVAFADANPEVLDRLAARGVPRERLFSDADEALNAVASDAVTVSIPNPHRVPALLRALQEGRHVLVDKPLVHTAEAVRALLDAGRDRKTVFMVAQNYRLFAGTQRIKALLDSGEIGAAGAMHVHFLRDSGAWRGRPVGRLPGILGLGMEMCIHHLDMMRYLLNAEPLEILARGWDAPWSGLEGFQGLQFHVLFPGGVNVAYDADIAAAYNRTDWNGHWEVLAEAGSVSYGDPGRSVRAYRSGGEEFVSDAGPNEGFDTAQSMDQVWRLFKDAIARVQAGASPLDTFCPLEDNVNSVAMVLAAERSIAEGRAVAIAPPPYAGVPKV